jgi:hypothetical protein
MKILPLAGVAAAAAAGLTVGLLALAPAAHAYSVHQLPSLGYSVEVTTLVGGCREYSAGYGKTPRQLIGTDCDGDWQAKLDAFVQATCPCAQTTTTEAPAPPVEPVPPPATNTTGSPEPSPPPTTTEAGPPTTATTTAPDPISDLAARITALEQQIAALTSRVDRLEKAGDAATRAFERAIEGGATPADAADQARGTWLNAVYGLGAFA